MSRSTRGLRGTGGVSGWMAAASGRSGGRSVVCSLGAAVLLLAGAVPAAAQFSVTPVILELETADSTETGTIRVRNESDDEVQLRFYPGDFEQDSLGEHRFMEAGTHERSCGDRLFLFPEGATLGRGESVEIVARMEPESASCWSTVFVESGRRGDRGINVVQRIAVKVFGSSRTASPAAEVREVDVEGDRLRVKVENTGERAFVATGEVEIRSQAGAVVEVLPLQEFSVLPGRTRLIPVALPEALEPGRYLAIPIVDFGGDYLAGGQALFERD